MLATTPVTVARKLQRLSILAKMQHAALLNLMKPVEIVEFDDMETFEHSKCKPVSITVAVESGSRRIIAAKASQMPAKGHLTHIARKRYGYRKDMRAPALAAVLKTVSRVGKREMTVKSDECPRYTKAVRTHLPDTTHQTFKGRKACVVGQGELKAGGFDPLFSLNHTCAMFRDNTKRLSRRSWCTTKRIDRLQCLLDIYICYHNNWIGMDTGTDRLPPSDAFIQRQEVFKIGAGM